MNISLTHEFEEFIRNCISSGDYANPTDVIQDGLLLLKQRAEVRELNQQANPTEAIATNWVERRSGSMIDFPEFDEVVRLGRKYRETECDSAREDV